jgi:hypothetical protein
VVVVELVVVDVDVDDVASGTAASGSVASLVESGHTIVNNSRTATTASPMLSRLTTRLTPPDGAVEP